MTLVIWGAASGLNRTWEALSLGVEGYENVGSMFLEGMLRG